MMLNVHMIQNWVLANFALSMAILAVPLFLIHMLVNAFTKKSTAYDIIFRWICLLPVGVAGVYWFVLHVFFPYSTAAILGLQNSPFQLEAGLGYLVVGALGILAFWSGYGFRVATVVAATCFFGGIAVHHSFQAIVTHNVSLTSTGSWFWMSVLLPIILIICILKMHPDSEMKTKQYGDLP